MSGEGGRLFNQVLQLDFNVDTFQIGWDEVKANLVIGLQILRDERRKYQLEKQDEAEQQRQEEFKRQQANRGQG